LGVARNRDDKTIVDTSLDAFEKFKQHHLNICEASDDPGLQALLAFLKIWRPERLAELQYSSEIVDQNIAFRFDDGSKGFLHERAAARELWERLNRVENATGNLCLVTGETSPIARLHPSIKGVRDAQSSGASIISFNQESFRSYGKDQGDNAPVSEIAAFAYTTALNDLLRKGSRNRIQLADATTVFWAEAEDAADAEAAESFFGFLSAPPDDADSAAKMRPVMQRMEQGRPLDVPELHFRDNTKFYILGLSPNAARLSVRFWHRTTLGDLGNRFHQHWRDLRIDGLRWVQPPAIWLLLTRIAPARRNEQGQIKFDSKHIPPTLAGELTRAILTGSPYPRTLLSNLLMRLRTDRVVDGLRVALIKACLVRAMRLRDDDQPKEVYVSLNREELNPAYRLGRLFAVLEKSQEAALEGVNATIRDRFYGSASATPAAVFPILIRNGMHHLAGLRKGRGARWVKSPAATGAWLANEMGDILNGLSRDWPKSFTMEDQGRFAIGYFHQRFAKREGAPDEVKNDAPIDEIASDNL
jgi:CRISPR-associated protein Csd1